MRNRLRTLATGFAVTCGLFLLIVLQGAGNGVIHTFEQNSSGMAYDAIRLYPGFTSKPYKGTPEWYKVKLEEEDGRILQQAFPQHIAMYESQHTHTAKTASTNREYLANVYLHGVCPSMLDMRAIQMVEGRFVNAIDMEQRRKTIVISDRNARELFKHDRTPLGAQVNVDGLSFTVVGVYKNDNTMGDNEFYAPYTTVRALYAKSNTVDRLHLKVKNLGTEEANQEFEQRIRNTLALRHDFDPSDQSAVWVRNSATEQAAIAQTSNILHTSFWVLGLLTLVSGIVGVSNIMLISVRERTHEFGIRKALGATPLHIVASVVAESVAVTTLFGYMGMFLGILFCEYMAVTVGSMVVDISVEKAEVFIDPTVDVGTCLQATLVIIAAGALAGFFPAYRAAKVKPIEALRG